MQWASKAVRRAILHLGVHWEAEAISLLITHESNVAEDMSSFGIEPAFPPKWLEM